MMVDLDQLIAIVEPPIINAGSVGRISHDHQSIVIDVAFNFIHRTDPIKSWDVFANDVDLLVGKRSL